MASIFTYDPDPPRVASPWLRDPTDASDGETLPNNIMPASGMAHAEATSSQEVSISNRGAPRLQAEPQEGPVEYKLHLLLRPRRRFTTTSTSSHVSGSRHIKDVTRESLRNIPESGIDPVLSSGAATPPTSSTQQTRQHRLEQLTTQLLWRLQQSSPYHTSSATNIILPSLPEALPELQAPQQCAKLLHGLEESRGALYEIGVADDGTLVGLAEDEMEESLNNLRAMAACLGCTVKVLRRETVGQCEWLEDRVVSNKQQRFCRHGRLIVVEALIEPYLQSSDSAPPGQHATYDGADTSLLKRNGGITASYTEQLRITLTGPTMSGKSTLLGTLTTSTQDNGRGKSRLSMLKHRHEISSGVTSSVTQELIGYQDAGDGCVEVLNYAAENIASWNDIHAAAAGSRVVFISDSAGHPRYRRTIVRGLVGWEPHWTLLCVPASAIVELEVVSANNSGALLSQGSAMSDMHVFEAQLNLCLRLHLPIVVVITKLDLASRAGLKSVLTKVLDALKAAGRKPSILANIPGELSEEDLHTVESSVIDGAYDIALPLLNDPVENVPIVLTSAVVGSGIPSLHALLHELPIPDVSHFTGHNLGVLFHIEDIYTKTAEAEGVIVSGRLRAGQISVGDRGYVGPFSTLENEDSEDPDERFSHRRASVLPASRSFPGALCHSHLAPPRVQLPDREWRQFKVTSVRNLRNPVHSLAKDQVGTVAILPHDNDMRSAEGFRGIRKGMVLTAFQPLATRTFVAAFKRDDLESLAVGNHVVVYIASVRASARVVSARAPDSPSAVQEPDRAGMYSDNAFEFDDLSVNIDQANARKETESVAGRITAFNLLVTFTFDASKEFVVQGDQVLVMPGGGPGLSGGNERGEKGVAGLDGFVGNVVEVFG